MNAKNKIAIIAPVFIVGSMYPIFQLTSRTWGYEIGWFLGMTIYWLAWGFIYPLMLIGRKTIRDLIKPQKINLGILVMVLFPLIMSLIMRLYFGMEYHYINNWVRTGFIFSVFANGFLEEILWRGTYMHLFPRNTIARILWPNFWFGIWHYAPGSISPDKSVISLMIGAVFLGLYSALVAKRTKTLCWSVIIHTLGGIIVTI